MPKKSFPIWFYPTKIFPNLTAPCNDTFKRLTKLMTNKLLFLDFSVKLITIIVYLILYPTCLIIVYLILLVWSWSAAILSSAMYLEWWKLLRFNDENNFDNDERIKCRQWWFWRSLIIEAPRILWVVRFVLRHLQHPVRKPGHTISKMAFVTSKCLFVFKLMFCVEHFKCYTSIALAPAAGWNLWNLYLVIFFRAHEKEEKIPPTWNIFFPHAWFFFVCMSILEIVMSMFIAI